METQATEAGREDQRPAKVEEVWIAIGPFKRLGKWVVGVALTVLLGLAVAGCLALWAIHGDFKERNQMHRIGGK